MGKRAALLIVASLAGLTWAATAAASCMPRSPGSLTRGYSQDGWAVGPFDGEVCLNGSRVNVENHSPYVYSGSTSSEWTALYNNTDGGYGQIGSEKQGSGVRFDFYQVNDTDTGHMPVEKDWAADPVGSDPQYEITYSAGAFHVFVNGTNYYNPASPTYSGCSAEQAGEIHNRADQMYGEVSNHDPFTHASVRKASNNSWFNTVYWDPYNDNVSWFGDSESGTPWTTIQIWDKDCP